MNLQELTTEQLTVLIQDAQKEIASRSEVMTIKLPLFARFPCTRPQLVEMFKLEKKTGSRIGITATLLKRLEKEVAENILAHMRNGGTVDIIA